MIALCVGHSRPGHSGARGMDGTTEWSYNSDLAGRVGDLLDDAKVPYEIIMSYPAASYQAAMKWLGGQLQSWKATLAVELHFNSSRNQAATGHEWLYWHGSTDGRYLARYLDSAMRSTFPGLAARGCKMITAKDNGAGFVRGMVCPAVICEPFFGSNWKDWSTVAAKPELIAGALAVGLTAAFHAFQPKEGRGK